MEFKVLAEYFEKLEGVSSQNTMIKVLGQLFKKAGVDDIDKVCYYLGGRVYPGYVETTLGTGNKMIQKSIALAGGLSVDEVEAETKQMGDLGDVASDLVRTRKNKFEDYFKSSGSLSVEDVDEGLKKIANASGSGSQDVMVKTLAGLLIEAGKMERKYITRLVSGAMRLGVGDMTILDGLAEAFLGSKDERPPLEHAYNMCSDLGHVAKTLKKSGLSGVKRIRIALNRPIKPMLAQRVSKFSDIREKISSERISAEEKYDGERIQAHKNGDEVKLFSRRLSDITSQFPDVVEQVREHVGVEKVVLDGEVVAYDFESDEFVSFQKLMRRRRKYDIEEYAKKIPVKYMVFDILYLNGKSLLRKSYPERKKKLKQVLRNCKLIARAGRVVSDDLDVIDDFFQECVSAELEGIICKSTGDDSFYRAGAREWSWIKWKSEYSGELSDTLDLVVIGGFAGKGKRGGTYGALLCAAYNSERDVFQTVCKLGTGFTDEQLENLPKKFEEYEVGGKPARVEVTKNMKPDYWFTPRVVVEVLGAEITESPSHTAGREKDKGLALRFPRFKRWRPEKKPSQATSVSEIKKMRK